MKKLILMIIPLMGILFSFKPVFASDRGLQLVLKEDNSIPVYNDSNNMVGTIELSKEGNYIFKCDKDIVSVYIVPYFDTQYDIHMFRTKEDEIYSTTNWINEEGNLVHVLLVAVTYGNNYSEVWIPSEYVLFENLYELISKDTVISNIGNSQVDLINKLYANNSMILTLVIIFSIMIMLVIGGQWILVYIFIIKKLKLIHNEYISFREQLSSETAKQNQVDKQNVADDSKKRSMLKGTNVIKPANPDIKETDSKSLPVSSREGVKNAQTKCCSSSKTSLEDYSFARELCKYMSEFYKMDYSDRPNSTWLETIERKFPEEIEKVEYCVQNVETKELQIGNNPNENMLTLIYTKNSEIMLVLSNNMAIQWLKEYAKYFDGDLEKWPPELKEPCVLRETKSRFDVISRGTLI